MSLPFFKPVTLVRNPGSPTEQKLAVQGNVQPDKGFFPANTPIYEGDVIELPDPRGGTQRLTVAHVKVYSAGNALDHLEAVWDRVNLSPTNNCASVRSGSVIQNFNGPIGAVQTGDGATANVVQNVGAQFSEIAPLLDSVLRASADLSATAQQEVREQVNELRGELAEVKPKPSRVKAFLAAMWQVTKDVATVAPKVLELAEKLGYPLLPK